MRSRCDTLDPFLDGALSRAGAKAFRRHLPACPGCQRRLSSVLQLAGLTAEVRSACPFRGRNAGTARR